MDTFIKMANGYEIKYCSAGNVYYIKGYDGYKLFEHEELEEVEKFCWKIGK